MPELTVVDTVSAHTLERGDLIRTNAGDVKVLDLIDSGGEQVEISFVNDTEDEDSTWVDAFQKVPVLGYALEEVFV